MKEIEDSKCRRDTYDKQTNKVWVNEREREEREK